MYTAQQLIYEVVETRLYTAKKLMYAVGTVPYVHS
jgi:hypothetical protein